MTVVISKTTPNYIFNRCHIFVSNGRLYEFTGIDIKGVCEILSIDRGWIRRRPYYKYTVALEKDVRMFTSESYSNVLFGAWSWEELLKVTSELFPDVSEEEVLKFFSTNMSYYIQCLFTKPTPTQGDNHA